MTNDNVDCVSLREESGTRHFDDYLLASEGPLVDVSLKVIDAVSAYEMTHSPRVRRRKPSDQRAFETSIESIVSNLSHCILESAIDFPLIVSRSHGDHQGYSNGNIPVRTFVSCLDAMEGLGFLTQALGVWGAKATTIRATQTFREMVQCAGVDFACFRNCPTRPLLVLTRSIRKNAWIKPKKVPVPFVRDTATEAMVSQIERLNAFLGGANISFVDDGKAYLRVNTITKRTIVRRFSLREGQGLRFDQGGRLFGDCWWLTLKSTQRQHIRINGESVADLDFKNLGPRLVYARMGIEPPQGDLYDLTGFLEGYRNDNPLHRGAIKKAFAACLNGGAGGKRGPSETLDALPRGTTAAKVRAALSGKHPAFSGILRDCVLPQVKGTAPLGLSIMFDESRVLLCALEMLMAQGVVALPFHDGLMVARSNQKIAQEALQAASLEIMRVSLPVSVKADYGAREASEELLAA